MRNLATAEVLDDLVARLRRLTPTQPRVWGTMNVHQMVRHLGDGAAAVLQQREFSTKPRRGPTGLLRFVALYLAPRMPRGIRTGANPAATVVDPGDFDRDRERAVTLTTQLASASAGALRAQHPIFGVMSRADWMRYAFLHTDHHLRQFGA